MTATLVALIVTLVSACGQEPSSTGGPTGSTTAPSGPVTISHVGYTGSLTFEQRPQRIVADSYSAAVLAYYGIKPVGVFGFSLDDPSVTGGVDLSSAKVIGKDSDLDLEALAALHPDVIVGYGGESPKDGWAWWDPKVAAEATKNAPFLAVEAFDQSPGEIIEGYAGLAKALGADTDAEKFVKDRSAYAAATKAVKDATAANDIRVLAISSEGGTVYGAGVLTLAVMLRELGVKLVGPTFGPKDYWTEMSWEQVQDYPADLVMPMDGSDYAGQPLYKALPAVKAGQVLVWNDKRAYTPAQYATWLDEVAGAIRDDRRVG